MSRKTKINVLLPFKMVGELEERSRLGKRSQFIQEAIRSKLDGKDSLTIQDYYTENIAAILVNRMPVDGSSLEKIIVLAIMEWMNQ